MNGPREGVRQRFGVGTGTDMRKRGWEGGLQSAARNSTSEKREGLKVTAAKGAPATVSIWVSVASQGTASTGNEARWVGGGLKVTSLEERKRRRGQESGGCRCGPRCRA